jgi:hypothetical protein
MTTQYLVPATIEHSVVAMAVTGCIAPLISEGWISNKDPVAQDGA